MSQFEYSQSTLNWIKAAEERELESQQRYLKTQYPYIKELLNEKDSRISELEEEVALLKLKLQRKIEIIKIETYKLEE